MRAYWLKTGSVVVLMLLAMLPPLGGEQMHRGAALADGQSTEAAEELAEIRKRIKAIQANLENDQAERQAVSIELEKFERQVAAAAKKLTALNEELEISQANLAEAQREQQTSEKRLAAEREALVKQVQAAYIMGSQQHLKLLLNQEDPSKMGRMLVYYDYLNKARSERLQAVKSELTRLAKWEQRIRDEAAQLQQLQTQQQTTLQRLEANRQERQRIVEQLTQAIAAGGTALEHSAKAEQALSQLLQSLARDLRDIPPDIGGRRAFSQQKGRLRWPVTGQRQNRYNAWREPGKLRWGGIMIAAPQGAPVRAVSYGRVVYADWMPRFGMVLIVDHGGSYMSLYAHNDTIYKKVGDKVEPGQVIAAVGNSGGQQQSGLYFEIRRKGNTVNPALWCKRPAAS